MVKKYFALSFGLILCACSSDALPVSPDDLSSPSSSSHSAVPSYSKSVAIVASVSSEQERNFVLDAVPRYIASRGYDFEVNFNVHPAYADATSASAFEIADLLIANISSIKANLDAGIPFAEVDQASLIGHEYLAEGEFKRNDAFYCYPFSVASHEVVYYDKSVFEESDLATWDGIINKAHESSETVSWNSDSIFAKTAFFYGAGAKTEYTYGPDFSIVSVSDNFDVAGLPAAIAMSDLYADAAVAIDSNVESALSVGGIWDYESAKSRYGDDFGVASFPGFVSDGTGYPCMANLLAEGVIVKSIDDEQKLMVANDIAKFLSSIDGQRAYASFEDLALPAAKEAIEYADLNDLKSAVAGQADQGFVLPEDYDLLYTYLPELERSIYSTKGEASEAILQGYLNTYHQKVTAIK